MAKNPGKYPTAEMEIVMIELLNSTMNMPTQFDEPTAIDFNFNVHIESSAESDNKLVFVMVLVEISDDDTSALLATAAVSCVFALENFEEVIKIKANGDVDMPRQLVEALNTQAIATTRGVMYATFKGTFLHDAILPVNVTG